MINAYQMSISLERWRGFHDSTSDFPLNPAHESQYPPLCNTDIVIAFNNITYKLPGIFLHYIDDVDSIGFSWVPPKAFIECLQKGSQANYQGDKEEAHLIGYLTKRDGKIWDESGEAQTSPTITIDADVLALMKRIYQFVEANDNLTFGSRMPFDSVNTVIA